MAYQVFGKVWEASGLTGSWGRKRDDSVVFEGLVARYQERFYRVAYRMTGSHEDAQDLLQEALIEAYKAFGHFRKGTYFDKWLFRIITRTFIDFKRVKQRHPIVYLDELTRSGDDLSGRRPLEIPDITQDPAFRIEQDLIAEPLQMALDSLPPDFRLAVILADIEQMSYVEISEMVQCPVGTVRSRLHRARSMMLHHLKSNGFEFGLMGPSMQEEKQ